MQKSVEIHKWSLSLLFSNDNLVSWHDMAEQTEVMYYQSPYFSLGPNTETETQNGQYFQFANINSWKKKFSNQ